MTTEQQIIGSLFMDEDAIGKIADTLEPQMFQSAVCGKIYSDFLKGYRVGSPINPYTIQERYAEQPEVIIEMNACVEGTLMSVGIEEAADLVKKSYRARVLSDQINRVQANADNIDDVLAKMQILIDKLSNDKITNCVTLGELAKKYRHEYFKEREMIQFGMKKLDTLIGSLDRGDVTVIGARPSVGKSALSAQLGKKMAERGYKVGYFIFEMPDRQLYERYAASESGIPMMRIRQATRFLNDEEERFNRANDELEKSTMNVIENCRTVDDIRKVTKAFGFDLIIVDYLQLVKATKTYAGNRVNEVSEVSADFKRLGMELKTHVVVLSQLNRKTEEKARPTMADLRESGAIEQDASNVILMWDLKVEGEKGLFVEKCRQGKRGGIVMTFDGDQMKFTETDKDLEEEEKWKSEKRNPFRKKAEQ